MKAMISVLAAFSFSSSLLAAQDLALKCRIDKKAPNHNWETVKEATRSIAINSRQVERKLSISTDMGNGKLLEVTGTGIVTTVITSLGTDVVRETSRVSVLHMTKIQSRNVLQGTIGTMGVLPGLNDGPNAEANTLLAESKDTIKVQDLDTSFRTWCGMIANPLQ